MTQSARDRLARNRSACDRSARDRSAGIDAEFFSRLYGIV